ncbi:MAG TPA: sodium/sugar symporter [Steroidobacteraceae bacterium]|nr:sodium/sugar symporter [Steroidobacteraceae bacterium]
MNLATIDITILVIYAVGIFLLAQWVSREKGTHEKNAQDYFLASRALPWWAIGTSLIAANISAEQIVGMSGSGYVMGMAIASYEWMAALTLIVVGKWILPVFLKNGIYTMPEFLEKRYSPAVRTVMAIFWLALYIFVNLTSILWLGALAVNAIAGLDIQVAITGLALFALVYALYGGLKAVALTDIVQVSLLVLGGIIITYIALDKVGDGAGVIAGFKTLTTKFPDKFDMILSPDSPHYKDLPGLAVLLGGMWMMNVSYWGFNQYIIQRGLAAKSVNEAQKGIVLAAFLKLVMPAIIVLPGIAALVLVPGLEKTDQAYPSLMAMLPVGIKGLVFAALVAAIVASTGSKINSIATIFTMDLYRAAKPDTPQKTLVTIGRIVAIVSVIIAVFITKPFLSNFGQGFQYIQNFTGFVTPGICVIFLLGLFWARTTATAAMTSMLATVILSWVFYRYLPDYPFMNRVGWCFVAGIVIAVGISLLSPNKEAAMKVDIKNVDFSTGTGFNVAAGVVILVLAFLYYTWW